MPLMQPTQNAWVNGNSPFAQSQFANSAQGYQAGNTFATSQPVTAQQAPTNSTTSTGFMSPNLTNVAAKTAGKFVANGFTLDGLLGASPASASVPASAVGQATETFLPANFSLGGSDAFGGVIPSGFGNGPSPIGDIVNSTWKDVSSTFGSLGGQAFGANGFAGTLGSNSLDLVGNGIANFGAGFVGTKLGSLIGGGGPNASVGGTVGGAIGSAYGPVGSLIGSTLGSIVGGFFGGKKKPNPEGSFGGISVSKDGTLSGGALGQAKHVTADSFNPLVNDFSSYLKSNLTKYGISELPDGLQAEAFYSIDASRLGGDKERTTRITVYNPATEQSASSGFFNPSDEESRNRAYEQAFNGIATLAGLDPTKLTPAAGQAGTAGTSPGVRAGGTITVKQGTQGSFNAFMKTYQGGNNVQATA